MAETAIRVRYAETDAMGIVYYANYLVYMEVGRVEFLRQNGHAMSEVNKILHMPVVEATVKYVKPAKLDDLLNVTCRVSERKRASFTFSYEIRNEMNDLVATGSTVHACVDPKSGKVIAIPDWLGAIMDGGSVS